MKTYSIYIQKLRTQDHRYKIQNKNWWVLIYFNRTGRQILIKEKIPSWFKTTSIHYSILTRVLFEEVFQVLKQFGISFETGFSSLSVNKLPRVQKLIWWVCCAVCKKHNRHTNRKISVNLYEEWYHHKFYNITKSQMTEANFEHSSCQFDDWIISILNQTIFWLSLHLEFITAKNNSKKNHNFFWFNRVLKLLKIRYVSFSCIYKCHCL